MGYTLKRLIRKVIELSLLSVLFHGSMAYAKNSEDIMVVRGKSVEFVEVVNGLRDDLDGEYGIVEILVEKETSLSQLSNHISKIRPALIVLVGNKALNLYVQYQGVNKDSDFPPAISVSALFVDKYMKMLVNTSAVRYEVPAVSSVVSIRNILKQPVKRVGVIYRQWMNDWIEENREYCKAEKIELVGVKLPNEPKEIDKVLREAINRLYKEVDVLWIPNDNFLVNRGTLINTWLPQNEKMNLPTIVGVELLVGKVPLGSFAVVPDNYALGAQLSEMIFEIAENDWVMADVVVQEPVSIRKTLNKKILDDKGIKYHNDKLGLVDRIIR